MHPAALLFRPAHHLLCTYFLTFSANFASKMLVFVNFCRNFAGSRLKNGYNFEVKTLSFVI